MATRKTAKKAAKKAPAKTTTTSSRTRMGLVGKAKPKPGDARMPGEQHPGQTGATARMHEQPGSQIERERHLYGGSTTPKRGAGRTNKKAVAKARSKRK